MRQENSVKNIITTIIPYFIFTFLAFIRVRVYLDTLGQEIYSLNQLFFQVFSYISIVEAGAGALVTQFYYKALADKNKTEINIIYTSSKYTLRNIAAIILLIGSGISFFLNYLTNNNLSLHYMQIAFILYLIRSILEYIMLAPRFVLQADQKMYKINIMLNAYKIGEMIIEMALLLFGMDYLIILFATIIIRVISYYLTNRKIFKEYKWLKTLAKSERIKIRGMGYVFCHKISGVVYNNTDILLISSFLTTLKVTVYSSYNLVIKFMSDISFMCAAAIAPSLGNVMAIETDDNKINILEELNMLFFSMAMIITASLYVVLTPFVAIWLGSQYLMDNFSLALMLGTLFHFISRRPMVIMNEVNNLFKKTQFIVILQAAINLSISLLLIKKMGMTGVLLATVISTVLTDFVFYPNIIYKSALKKNAINYYFNYLTSIFVTIIICYLGNKCIIINNLNIFVWFIESLGYFLIIFIIILGINWTISKAFRSIIFKILNYIRKQLKIHK